MEHFDYIPSHAFTNIGFDILRKKRLLRSQMVDLGEEAYTEFLRACIASGIDHHDELIEGVLDIVGPNVEPYVKELLAENDGVIWRKGDDGIYSLLIDHTHEIRWH